MRDMICDLCKNKEFSRETGQICGLTMKKATVRYSCELYEKDELLNQRYEREDNHSKDAELRKNESQIKTTTNRFFSFCAEVLLLVSRGK